MFVGPMPTEIIVTCQSQYSKMNGVVRRRIGLQFSSKCGELPLDGDE